jgi:hypothetical protein
MNAPRDPDRLIRAFLMEGEELLEDQVYDAVRAEIDQKRQRTFIGPWRTPLMNRSAVFGLGAVAVVVIGLFLGSQLLGTPGNTGSGGPTATPEPSVAEATSTPAAFEPRPVVVTGADAPVQVTVNVTSSGWVPFEEFELIGKDDDSLDPPESVGVALLAWSWPAGTGFDVYGDPCAWSTTIPETPATTPEELATAFAAQAMTAATAPVDVTVGGYAGKAVTLHVPISFDIPGATREEKFGDCDSDVFGFYGVAGESEPTRNAQGAGQIDELWIVDVDGSIVIIDATYAPAAPAELVAELRALAESATFELP